MRSVRLSVLLLVTFVILGAAGCSRGVTTTVDQVTVTTSVTDQNVAEAATDEVPAGSEAIYLSARVNYPTKDTVVQVKWYRLPGQFIAVEDFYGRYGSVQRFDFNEDARQSFLASRLERTGVSWAVGEYRVEVFLNGELVQTAFFKVISDVEALAKATAQKIQGLELGDTLNSQFKVDQDKVVFARTTDHIYIQVNVADADPNTKIETNVRYVKEDRAIANFTSEVTGNKELVLSMSRERFGRLWPDSLWPEGTFEVEVEINGIQAKTKTFQVE